MLTFVTSNEEKVYFAHKALDPRGISFRVQDLSVEEIQSASPEHIIRRKAEAAWQMLHEPLMVNDHFWSIPSLQGFPGAYMKYMNEWLTSDDLLRLVGDTTDRRAFLEESVCYMDEHHQEVFSDRMEGVILQTPEGKGLPCQEIVSLSGDGHSIAYHLNHYNNPRGDRAFHAWEKLATYLAAL